MESFVSSLLVKENGLKQDSSCAEDACNGASCTKDAMKESDDKGVKDEVRYLSVTTIWRNYF